MRETSVAGRLIGVSWLAVVMLAVPAVPASAQSANTSSLFDGQPPARPGAHAAVGPSAIPCQGGENTLLIQDVVPWADPTGSPLGGNVDELLASGIPFCIIASADLATTALFPFKVVIVSSGQTQDFYDNVFPGGALDLGLFSWVDQGGILVGHLADCASGPGNGGVWARQPCPDVNAATSYAFEGGLLHVLNLSDDNNIGASLHPIITANVNGTPLPCPSGNCGQIVDNSQYTDLDGWGFSSHAIFTALIAGSNIILTDPTPTGGPQPVMVEYNSACGRVIATTTTIEFRYVGGFGDRPQNKKLLANELAYAEYLATLAPFCTPN